MINCAAIFHKYSKYLKIMSLRESILSEKPYTVALIMIKQFNCIVNVDQLWLLSSDNTPVVPHKIAGLHHVLQCILCTQMCDKL